MNWLYCQSRYYISYIPYWRIIYFFQSQIVAKRAKINTRWSLTTIFFQNCSTRERLHPKRHFPKHVFGLQQRGILVTWHFGNMASAVSMVALSTGRGFSTPFLLCLPYIHWKTFTEAGFKNWEWVLFKFTQHEQYPSAISALCDTYEFNECWWYVQWNTCKKEGWLCKPLEQQYNFLHAYVWELGRSLLWWAQHQFNAAAPTVQSQCNAGHSSLRINL